MANDHQANKISFVYSLTKNTLLYIYNCNVMLNFNLDRQKSAITAEDVLRSTGKIRKS